MNHLNEPAQSPGYSNARSSLVLHVSDFHARETWYQWLVLEASSKRWAAIVFSGDFLDMFAPPSAMRNQIAMASAQLMAIPTPIPLLLCSGNHDCPFGVEDKTPTWLRHLARKRANTFIDGDRVPVQDTTLDIIGWSGSPNKAADFYVTHTPPAGANTARSERGDWGNLELAGHLQAHGGIALCGHVHAPQQWHDLRPGFGSLNPAVGDILSPYIAGPADAPAVPPHVVIDLARKIAFRGDEGVRLDPGIVPEY